MKTKYLFFSILLLILGFAACKKSTIEDKTEVNVSEPSTVKSLALGGSSLNVPMGGNAFVTTLASGSFETVTSNTLSNWTNSNSIFSAYFRLGNTGSLTVKLKATVPSGSSVIKVTVNGTPFNVSLSGTTSTTYNVGTVNISSAGYVKVDFQGVSKTGSYYADVSDLVISGPVVASNVVFANDASNFGFSRRGPSVHLNFTAPTNTQYFYSEVTVPSGQDKVGSYFMANGTNTGYFGMQVNSATERRILHSCWNPASGTTTVLRKGANVVANTFSGEGEGAQTYLVFNWKAGTTYRFLTEGKPDGAGSTIYTSWFYAPEVGAWQLISALKKPNTASYLTGLYSFLENFSPDNGFLDRRAEYGNQWVRNTSGTWTELTTANYTGDATAANQQRLDLAGGLSNGKFYLKNGGFFNNYITPDQNFTRPATGTPPSINFPSLP